MKPVWLTVDSDDIRHTPKFQGHPTRSKGVAHKGTSNEMKDAMNAFRNWLDRTQATPTFTGPPSGSPVILIIPLIA